GYLASTSVLSAAALGEFAPDFDADLRRELAPWSVPGGLRQDVLFACDLARRPPGRGQRYASRYLMAAMTRRLSVSDGGSPSLAKMLAICFSTTPPVMTSVSAMAVFERPSAIRARTSRSR